MRTLSNPPLGHLELPPAPERCSFLDPVSHSEWVRFGREDVVVEGQDFGRTEAKVVIFEAARHKSALSRGGRGGPEGQKS